MIELERLSKRYGAALAVDDLSLRVARGELLVLLGGSGSGKTTTLKMVNRLIEPSAGSVRIDGRDTRELAPHALRRRIGYCFQQVGLFPHLSVARNVAITPTLLGWSAHEIAARVDELLERVELEPTPYRDRRPASLSGGEQQRVGLARALAAEPELMLLDEPFGALDPLTRESLQLVLERPPPAGPHRDLRHARHGRGAAARRSHRGAARGPARAGRHSGELLRAPADDRVAELLRTPRRQVEASTAASVGRPRTPERSSSRSCPAICPPTSSSRSARCCSGARSRFHSVSRSRAGAALEPAVLGAASVIQTIPGLALLAVMVPVLAGLGPLTQRALASSCAHRLPARARRAHALRLASDPAQHASPDSRASMRPCARRRAASG